MDSTDLLYFLAAARNATMGGAAKALNTVQSNVTGRIKRLEEDLGTPLFRRHARGITLTAAGERLLPYATQIADLLREARRAVPDSLVPYGPLVLGAMETTAALRLGGAISRFATRFPDVQLTLRTGTTAALVDQVLRQELEGALVCGPIAHPGLDVQKVFAETLVLLSAHAHAGLAALDGPVRIFVLRRGCAYRQRLEDLLARRGIGVADIAEYGTIDAILSCVAAGMGITLLPEALVALYDGRYLLRAHRLPAREGLVETVLVTRSREASSAALRHFMALLEAQDDTIAAA